MQLQQCFMCHRSMHGLLAWPRLNAPMAALFHHGGILHAFLAMDSF
jgi:hypothetical protein